MESADVPQETEPREEEVFTSWEPEEEADLQEPAESAEQKEPEETGLPEAKEEKDQAETESESQEEVCVPADGLPRLRMQPQKRIRRISGRMKAAQKKAFRKMRKIQNSLVKRLRFQRQSRKRTRIESRAGGECFRSL